MDKRHEKKFPKTFWIKDNSSYIHTGERIGKNRVDTFYTSDKSLLYTKSQSKS